MNPVAVINRSNCPAKAHGKYWMVDKYGCTCLDARLAKSAYRREREQGTRRTVDATAARRIVQGLACHGYTAEQIATLCGVGIRNVRYLQSGRKTTVWRSTDQAIREAGNRIRLDQYRTGYDAAQARAAARAHGWVPLTAWDDETIADPHARPSLGDPEADLADDVLVERVLTGTPQHLSPANQARAFEIGLARGMSINAVARQLRISYASARGVLDQRYEQAA